MIEIERAIVIARPVAEVFAFAADPANDPRWNEPIIATRLLTPGPAGVGTVFYHTARFLGQQFETTVEITDFVPNARACVRTTGGPLRSTGCRLFKAAGAATRLTIRISGEATTPIPFGESVATVAIRRQLDRDLARLKALLEE